MAHEDEVFAEVENVGYVDSVVRGSASIAILVAVMLMPSITAITLFGLTQLAIYAGLTAFIGWDPIYALIKQSESRQPIQAPAAVAGSARREAQPAVDDHKRAA